MPNIIRIKRKQRGMSQAQLAKEIGCTQGQISHIERDLNGASPDLAKAISTFLGIPLDAIVQADKSENATNRDTFRHNRAMRKLRKSLRHVVSATRSKGQPIRQRRLIFRFGKLAQVIND